MWSVIRILGTENFKKKNTLYYRTFKEKYDKAFYFTEPWIMITAFQIVVALLTLWQKLMLDLIKKFQL
jgi:hypothetical protein